MSDRESLQKLCAKAKWASSVWNGFQAKRIPSVSSIRKNLNSDLGKRK